MEDSTSLEESTPKEGWKLYSTLSYAFVLLVIGIPVWWYSTELYRVPLPAERMQQLGNAPLNLKLNIYISSKNKQFSDLIYDELTNYYNSSDLFRVNINKIEYNSNFLPKNKEISKDGLKIIDSFIKVGDILLVEWPDSPHHIYVSTNRVIYYNELTSGSKIISVLKNWILQEQTLNSLIKNMILPGAMTHDPTVRRRIPASTHYDILLTVVNPDPERIQIDWNIKKTSKKYLQPLLNYFSSMFNFTLTTQWLYYVNLDGNNAEINYGAMAPKQTGDIWTLNQNQLPYLITMLEKKLSTGITAHPCLNLVTYVTHCDQAPLYIFNSEENYKDETNSFLSPRWGGVVIINPDNLKCKNYSLTVSNPVHVEPKMNIIFSTFVTQLRLLLGIPQLEPISNAYLEPLTTIEPRKWEYDSLLRLRTLEQIMTARLTLKSLDQLLNEIKTIVINDQVGADIHKAVDNVEMAANHLAKGELFDAFNKSRTAFVSSESAFTDPSLLALLYFPDDQKYAVYIPLFLPVLTPVIFSLNIIRKWLKTKKLDKVD